MNSKETIIVTLTDGGTQSQVEIPAELKMIGPDGSIVGVATEKVRKELVGVITVLQVLTKDAVDTVKNVMPGGPPFKLNEIKFGLKIAVGAGIVVASASGDANLELKFVRV